MLHGSRDSCQGVIRERRGVDLIDGHYLNGVRVDRPPGEMRIRLWNVPIPRDGGAWDAELDGVRCTVTLTSGYLNRSLSEREMFDSSID